MTRLLDLHLMILGGTKPTVINCYPLLILRTYKLHQNSSKHKILKPHKNTHFSHVCRDPNPTCHDQVTLLHLRTTSHPNLKTGRPYFSKIERQAMRKDNSWSFQVCNSLYDIQLCIQNNYFRGESFAPSNQIICSKLNRTISIWPNVVSGSLLYTGNFTTTFWNFQRAVELANSSVQLFLHLLDM